jgi:hypothetical protein
MNKNLLKRSPKKLDSAYWIFLDIIQKSPFPRQVYEAQPFDRFAEV